MTYIIELSPFLTVFALGVTVYAPSFAARRSGMDGGGSGATVGADFGSAGNC